MSTAGLRERLPALESEVRSLSREEVVRFVDVVSASATAEHVWPPDRRFVFDGTADQQISADATAVARQLWTQMHAALVYAVTGKEVDAWIDRPGLLARLDRIGPRWRQIEGQAATILGRELGGQVWLGTIGIWNALCAALLVELIDPVLRDDLATSWRQVRPSGPVIAGLRP
jgi:hypothetical protein